MTRSSWKRAIATLLVVLACSLTVPAPARAAAAIGGMPTMDGVFDPVAKLWHAAVGWIRGLVPAPGERHRPGGDNKFGAGQSSDGRAKSLAAF